MFKDLDAVLPNDVFLAAGDLSGAVRVDSGLDVADGVEADVVISRPGAGVGFVSFGSGVRVGVVGGGVDVVCHD